VAPAGALAFNAHRSHGDKIVHAGSHAAIARLGEFAYLDEPRGAEVLAPVEAPRYEMAQPCCVPQARLGV